METDGCQLMKGKENIVYTDNGILFSHNKERKTAIATTWINLEDILLSEIIQTQKDTLV